MTRSEDIVTFLAAGSLQLRLGLRLGQPLWIHTARSCNAKMAAMPDQAGPQTRHDPHTRSARVEEELPEWRAEGERIGALVGAVSRLRVGRLIDLRALSGSPSPAVRCAASSRSWSGQPALCVPSGSRVSATYAL